MDQRQKHLLQLVPAKENAELQEIKKTFSNFSKYFFNVRKNITIVYEKSVVYVIHKDYLKIIDLGKVFIITDLVYNYERNYLLFLTTEGHLFLHFASSKSQVLLRKDIKKLFVMEWVYSANQTMNFFLALQNGVYLYRVQQEKKSAKQVKHLSGKYHCYLYEPISEILVGFQMGDCDEAYLFHFQQQKAKSWFKCGEIQVNLKQDDIIAERIHKKKSFGLQGSTIGKQIFTSKKKLPQDYFIDIQQINHTPYMFFYFSSEGKLQLTPLDSSQKRPITIKLPSDSLPSFNIYDNMLVVHLKNQKITFIYDINHTNFQPLVSPYPLQHQVAQHNSKLYNAQFISKRVILPDGSVAKWRMNIGVIYHYLKNEMFIFQFLNRRRNSKMQLIRWMRQGLFNFKQINLSKMWKSVFYKIQTGLHDQSEILSLIEIYSNIFYTLSIDPLISKEHLANSLIECIRQANQFHMPIPDLLQLLTTQILIQTEKFDLLAYLCYQDIIKPQQKVYRIIFQRAEKDKDQLLLTLSIDLAYQVAASKQVLKMILKSQRIKQGKRFVKHNHDKMQVLDFLEVAQYIRNFDLKREYINYVKSFILHKYPQTNPVYLQQAEKKLIG